MAGSGNVTFTFSIVFVGVPTFIGPPTFLCPGFQVYHAKYVMLFFNPIYLGIFRNPLFFDIGQILETFFLYYSNVGKKQDQSDILITCFYSFTFSFTFLNFGLLHLFFSHLLFFSSHALTVFYKQLAFWKIAKQLSGLNHIL